MPFVDTSSHLTTKPHNFDITCQSNSLSIYLKWKFYFLFYIILLYKLVDRRNTRILINLKKMSDDIF
jgi:hypothetical protein